MAALGRIWMYCALFVVVLVVGVYGNPPSPRADLVEANTHPHRHVKRPSNDADKVLAIGGPVAMSSYMEYGAPAPAPALKSWWGRSSYFYRAMFKCAKGEKRDAIGICRQPWDSIDPDDYFSF